jgi:hypothetical protein
MGGHINFFTHVPWVHLLFSEKTLFRVRQLYRNDGAKGYGSGLNKMTVSRFKRLINESGVTLESLHLGAIKGLPLVASVPGLREFLVNRVTCILTK